MEPSKFICYFNGIYQQGSKYTLFLMGYSAKLNIKSMIYADT